MPATWALSGCALLGVLALLSPFWPQLDVLTTFSPALVVLPLILLVVARLSRTNSAVSTALASISVGAGLWLMGPDVIGAWRQSGAAPIAGPGQRVFKVVTLNVWDEGVDREREIAFLRSVEADVIILEEAREDFTSRLGTLADAYPTRVTCSEYPYCGVVIFAKAPGRLLPGGAWLDAAPLSRPYPSFTWRYAAVELQVSTPAGAMVVPIHAVHIKRGALVGASARQLPILAEHVRQSPQLRHAIIAGDFNTTPWSHAMRSFDARVKLRRITNMAPTWPTRTRFGKLTPALIGIDHFYVGAEWRVLGVERGPDVGSDHYPVITWVAAAN